MINFPDITKFQRITLTSGTKRCSEPAAPPAGVVEGLIVMSDMHKGDGSGADDFARNSLIYCRALEHYLENDFMFVELGDAEELWENDKFEQIYITHADTYDLLAKFHDPNPDKTRYLKVWGNHDLYWRNNQNIYQAIFPDIQIHEGIILNDNVLMIHGHQADPVCRGTVSAAVSQFFVDHIWANLQKTGVKDFTTRAAGNPGIGDEVDNRLYDWATHNNKGISTIIAGHTHRAVFENLSLTEMRLQAFKQLFPNRASRKTDRNPCYYNTGCCVHPRSITGLEITMTDKINFQLVEWKFRTEGSAVSIGRVEL